MEIWEGYFQNEPTLLGKIRARSVGGAARYFADGHGIKKITQLPGGKPDEAVFKTARRGNFVVRKKKDGITETE